MTFRLLAAFAVALALAGAAAPADAIDCQNMRLDYQTICTDPQLRQADEAREVRYEKRRDALPSDEREAFIAYEARWLGHRNSCSDNLKECLSAAIGAHVAELAALEGERRLVFRQRRRVDPQANIDVHATWVEFVPSRSPGEALFNQRVAALTAGSLPFETAGRTSAVNEWMDILSIYRSPRFISLRFDGWSCCGSGTAYRLSVNVDLARAALLEPAEFFDLAVVKEACRATPAEEAFLDQKNWAFTHDGAFVELHPGICFLRLRDLQRAAKPDVKIPL